MVRLSVLARHFLLSENPRPEAHPGTFSVYICLFMKLITRLHLVPRSTMRGVIPPLHDAQLSTVGLLWTDKLVAEPSNGKHNTHNRQTSMPPVGFAPTISAGERPQTDALDCAATATCQVQLYSVQNSDRYFEDLAKHCQRSGSARLSNKLANLDQSLFSVAVSKLVKKFLHFMETNVHPQAHQ